MRINVLIAVLLVISGAVILMFVNNPDNSEDEIPKITDGEVVNNISGIIVLDIDKNEVDLTKFLGKVSLIVNVASECGYTPQYSGLEKIFNKYKNRGFQVLAFPCNQFGEQEPGTNEEIKNFCSVNYDVTFSLFDKIEVNGTNASPLYKMLRNSSIADTGDVKWNFEKFLIGKDGNVKYRFRHKVEPENDAIISAIENELNTSTN